MPKDRLERLAQMYADPKTKVMSFFTMDFNQHTRGTWCGHLLYNLHLLTGKISSPGNSPFSLTGQPSACGTAREVGTFSHRLPADMVVTNPKHRAEAERIWKLPAGTIPEKPGYHAVLQNRMLKDGKLNAYWVQVNNNMQAAPNLLQETYPGYRVGCRNSTGPSLTQSPSCIPMTRGPMACGAVRSWSWPHGVARCGPGWRRAAACGRHPASSTSPGSMPAS